MMKFALIASVASAAKFGTILEEAKGMFDKVKEQIVGGVEAQQSVQGVVDEKAEFAKKRAENDEGRDRPVVATVRPVDAEVMKSGTEMKGLFADLDLEKMSLDRISGGVSRKGFGWAATQTKEPKVNYNNKSLFFVTAENSCPAENSCYGATHEKVCCKSCRAVHESYKAQGWSFEPSKVVQCLDEPQHCGVNSCYGAKDGCCNTCDDVIAAYKGNYWAYDLKNFGQCIAEKRSTDKMAERPVRKAKHMEKFAKRMETVEMEKKLEELKSSMKEKLANLQEPETETLYV